MTTATYRTDLDALTVIRIDLNGEGFDLNADGEPCESVSDLRNFVGELHEQGAYDAATRDALLGELEEAMDDDDIATPADRWHLDEIARILLDGEEIVVYSDEAYTVAIDAKSFNAETDEVDYSLWCAGTQIVTDHGQLRRILAAIGDEDLYLFDGSRQLGMVD